MRIIISKGSKGKTWPMSSPQKLSKRKKSNGSLNQGTKRVKTGPLIDKTNQILVTKRSNVAQKKNKEEETILYLQSTPNIFAIASASSTLVNIDCYHQNVLISEETLDIEYPLSSQESEFFSNADERRSSTEIESNISNPPDSSCTSMDASPSQSPFNENTMIDEEHVGQDKPLLSFPKKIKTSSVNMTLAEQTSLPSPSIHRELTQSELVSVFDLLPEEILVAIFRNLPFLSRERISIVCKQWNRISTKFSFLDIFPTDIYGMMIKNVRKHRKHLKNYIESRLQTDINSDMRSVLVDWLIEVAEEFRIQPDTLFLSIHYIDQYLSRIDTSLTRSRFQLVGMTALLIASKYEELYVPTIADLIFISDNTYTREEIIAMEATILNVLNFDITVFTVKHFSQIYLNIIFFDTKTINTNSLGIITDFSHYLAELTLLNFRLAIQRPDRVASAIVSISLNTFTSIAWPRVLQQETFFNHLDLKECVEEIYKLHTNIAVLPYLSAIRNKARFAPQLQIKLPEMRYYH